MKKAPTFVTKPIQLKVLMFRNIHVLIVLALLFLGMDGWSQTTAPKYSNEFLSIGVGARALGMSNAYSAVSDDVSSGYWNPAGLLGVKSDLQLG